LICCRYMLSELNDVFMQIYVIRKQCSIWC
jgi:hypothetical protein